MIFYVINVAFDLFFIVRLVLQSNDGLFIRLIIAIIAIALDFYLIFVINAFYNELKEAEDEIEASRKKATENNAVEKRAAAAEAAVAAV